MKIFTERLNDKSMKGVTTPSPELRFIEPQRPWEKLLGELVASLNGVVSGYGSAWGEAQSVSAFDFEEKENEFLICMELPGVRKEDLHVDVSENIIRVRGERKEEYEGRGRSRDRVQRFAGAFARTFTLPVALNADQIDAQYADGFLRLTIPKVEAMKMQHVKIGDGKGVKAHKATPQVA